MCGSTKTTKTTRGARKAGASKKSSVVAKAEGIFNGKGKTSRAPRPKK